MSRKHITNPDDIVSVRVDMEEAETVIQLDRGGDYAEIYTTDNTMITKFRKLMAGDPDSWQCYGDVLKSGEITGYFFIVKKHVISFRSKKRKPRELSEEKRAEIAARLHKNRNKITAK